MKTRTIYKVEKWVTFGNLGDHKEELYFDTIELAAGFMREHCKKSWGLVTNLEAGADAAIVWSGTGRKDGMTWCYNMGACELIEAIGEEDA